ncbi:hypothetical protein TNCV_2860301 [Trichonephila clavipes]|nr:hypothetical protein TNCV_2860301 [Trichonephila clavipes]
MTISRQTVHKHITEKVIYAQRSVKCVPLNQWQLVFYGAKNMSWVNHESDRVFSRSVPIEILDEFSIGVPLAPCHDEFRGPRSDYVRQVALETTTTHVRVPATGVLLTAQRWTRRVAWCHRHRTWSIKCHRIFFNDKSRLCL